MRPLKIGTRGSALALWQANYVREALTREHPGCEVELAIIRTKGDEASQAGRQESAVIGFFTQRIERALADGRIDLAVHSFKDVPIAPREGLAIVAVPERGDAADALVTTGAADLASLPAGATVLTGSPRRCAQVLHRRPDLAILPVRGNVDTRVRKLAESGADALVLACAGLNRLGLGGRIAERFEPTDFVPACAQGALAVQARAGDEYAAEACLPLDHRPTRIAVSAERAFLAALHGGCRVPAGAFAEYDEAIQQLRLTGLAASEDGKDLAKCTATEAIADVPAAEGAGRRLAEQVLAAGGREILAGVRGS
jgi:hydroxymethylbilane synthase